MNRSDTPCAEHQVDQSAVAIAQARLDILRAIAAFDHVALAGAPPREQNELWAAFVRQIVAAVDDIAVALEPFEGHPDAWPLGAPPAGGLPVRLAAANSDQTPPCRTT